MSDSCPRCHITYPTDTCPLYRALVRITELETTQRSLTATIAALNKDDDELRDVVKRLVTALLSVAGYLHESGEIGLEGICNNALVGLDGVNTQRQHRWSGWPGAVCLNCGVEDQVEICVANCPNAFTRCACEAGCEKCCGTGMLPNDCPVHKNGSCPGPFGQTPEDPHDLRRG